MPPHDLICLLTLPPGSAVVYRSPPFPAGLIDRCSDIIVMGLQNNESYTLPIKLPEVVGKLSFLCFISDIIYCVFEVEFI